jgi:hypothetical protein
MSCPLRKIWGRLPRSKGMLDTVTYNSQCDRHVRAASLFERLSRRKARRDSSDPVDNREPADKSSNLRLARLGKSTMLVPWWRTFPVRPLGGGGGASRTRQLYILLVPFTPHIGPMLPEEAFP